VRTAGIRPESGKEDTACSREVSNEVSSPCENGEDADSAMKCGM
jgi:hypothetical protein